MSIKFFALLILSLTSLPVFGAELLEHGISVKALGMGNAYMAHSKGHDAPFYNPAGFASMSGFRWRVAGLNIGLNGLDVYEEYEDIFDNSDDLASTLNQLYGRPIWARTDFQTSLSLGPIIVGGFGRANLGFTLLNPALPNLQTAYFADYALFAGWGLEIVPKYFDAGVMVKRITRYAGDVPIGASTLAHLDSELLEESIERSGTAYGVDFGATFKFPTPWNPSVSFVWKDIGDTTFNIGTADIAPGSLKDQMIIGVGFERDFGAFKLKPALDVKYLNYSDDIQIGKKLHAGLEIELPAGFALRGGLNQGYYTAGASFDFWLFQIDVATYGVELGEYVGQHEDRRYIFQLTADIGLDPTTGDFFSFTKAKKRSRGLKERR